MPTPIPEGLRLGAIEPQDAIAAFVRRGLLQPSFRWQDVWQEEHARAFTVAGVLQLDVLKAFQDEIDLSLREGRSLADFAQRIRPQLVKAGFWGDVDVTDPKTGEQRTTTFNDARLRLIYDVNLRQSHAAGRWARIERNKASHPFVMYRTRHDERVRQSHKPWHGLVLPVDAPFWKTHFPPNGWRCRCTAFAVSERDVQKYVAAGEPVKRSAPPAQTVDYVNPHTGQVLPVPRGIDPGFGYNPGRVQGGALTERVNTALVATPAPVAKAVLQQSLAQSVFTEFVRKPLAGQMLPVAVLPAEDAALIRAQTTVVNLSADTAIKQLDHHPEIQPADYLNVQRAIDEGEKIQDGEFSLVYLLEQDGWVVAVKATRSGLGLFISSFRRLPSDQARLDSELRRLRRRAV